MVLPVAAKGRWLSLLCSTSAPAWLGPMNTPEKQIAVVAMNDDDLSIRPPQFVPTDAAISTAGPARAINAASLFVQGFILNTVPHPILPQWFPLPTTPPKAVVPKKSPRLSVISPA